VHRIENCELPERLRLEFAVRVQRSLLLLAAILTTQLLRAHQNLS